MKIVEMLKEALYSRITIGSRWLVYDYDDKKWEVYERENYANRINKLVSTKSEDEAVYHLLKGEDDESDDIQKKSKIIPSSGLNVEVDDFDGKFRNGDLVRDIVTGIIFIYEDKTDKSCNHNINFERVYFV